LLVTCRAERVDEPALEPFLGAHPEFPAQRGVGRKPVVHRPTRGADPPRDGTHGDRCGTVRGEQCRRGIEEFVDGVALGPWHELIIETHL
jgi:hypothetical protein